ncbi:NGG1p interacting factor NIF3 [Marinobacterium weihaiense]|uniref:NGG1p interacting factor NIF3 n=1 Tax=Marinobacterium weihaiense TaxID=2851016 RepID=A0ABS6M9D4_9GAMM|nr:NGG1p interacting factor NIF3 [Marinobacterium weihaiense]MBV0932387.1 NGG1p interacting factor NIF3 [Marinobacterium weihaiense]
MYKFCFFVPEAEAEPVKAALFAVGVGKIGDYDQCCFQTAGQGQFRPLAGANPHLGRPGELERVAELKVEMVCADELIHTAVATLKQVHPYEEVAYEVYKLADI